MALSCSTGVSQNQQFEFIDCSTLNINYDVRGIVTLSFSVISTSGGLQNVYTSLTFGGVTFNGFITSVDINPIPGTLVYEIRLNIVAFGC